MASTSRSSAPPSAEPQIIDIHTPRSSYSILHSLQQDTFATLLAKIGKKEGSASPNGAGQVVGKEWVKYEWNEGIWNLDDESDYAIFVWRSASSKNPTLHVRDPSSQLPNPVTDDYTNSAYYLLRPPPPPPKSTKNRSRSIRSMPNTTNGKKSRRSTRDTDSFEDDGIPVHKKEFEKHRSNNGVRTVIGAMGPVKGVRMLLKSSYRHVYISRKFAARHGFIPKDATPGHYGYAGIVRIGQFPVTVGRTTTTHTLYLSEEPHFDVVLGRAFIEKRGVQVDATDMTNVICRDTGEKLEIEVVVLKDGRGEVVTVT